jgi:hypothetical protein
MAIEAGGMPAKLREAPADHGDVWMRREPIPHRLAGASRAGDRG